MYKLDKQSLLLNVSGVIVESKAAQKAELKAAHKTGLFPL
jgi:hypothetical protein